MCRFSGPSPEPPCIGARFTRDQSFGCYYEGVDHAARIHDCALGNSAILGPYIFGYSCIDCHFCSYAIYHSGPSFR